MRLKEWFSKPRAIDPGLDVTQLVDWSLRCAREHDDMLPAWCSSPMQSVAVRYVVPIVVALKHQDIDPPLPESLLDKIEPGITRAIGESLFGAQVDDEELREVNKVLSQLTRQLTVFWLAAFQNFPARRYFGDQELLTKMLAGLIENPDYGLVEQFCLQEEEDLAAFSAGLASHIKACYAQISELSPGSS